jgi:hypothetical protein
VHNLIMRLKKQCHHLDIQEDWFAFDVKDLRVRFTRCHRFYFLILRTYFIFWHNNPS